MGSRHTGHSDWLLMRLAHSWQQHLCTLEPCKKPAVAGASIQMTHMSSSALTFSTMVSFAAVAGAASSACDLAIQPGGVAWLPLALDCGLLGAAGYAAGPWRPANEAPCQVGVAGGAPEGPLSPALLLRPWAPPLELEERALPRAHCPEASSPRLNWRATSAS